MSRKIVFLTPKGTEGASATNLEDFGPALRQGQAGSEPPRDQSFRDRKGIRLVNNATAVPVDIRTGLDAEQISDEVTEVIDRLRELVAAYKDEPSC
jgi:hypothetical protein